MVPPQRAADWAGRLSPSERGDPLAIVRNVNQTVESVQKAARLQMMHDRKLTPRGESPVMVPVDPERMIPLIRGLPEAVKPIGMQLKGQIESLPIAERAVATLEAAAISLSLNRAKGKVWTWGGRWHKN